MNSSRLVDVITALLLSVFLISSLSAQPTNLRQAETYKPPNYYPPIFFRGATHTGHHCTASQAEDTLRDEVYFIRQDPSKWMQGKSYDVDVAEFFSGKTYSTKLSAQSNYRGSLTIEARKVDINCADSMRIINIGKKEPMNSKGDYLTVVNIDMFGAFGENVGIEVCKVGAHCDVGTQGFVLKDKFDKELWGKVIAIRNREIFGHLTYKLPNMYNIQTDIFSFGTRLLDGTVLLSFDDRLTIRLTISTGTIEKQNSDVGVVDIQPWAQLKKILNARFLTTNDQCNGTVSTKECDWQKRTELYFYTLRDYLFPSK